MTSPDGILGKYTVEEFFAVVHYDQRGASRSFQLSDPDEVRATMHPAERNAWIGGRIPARTAEARGQSGVHH